jgi:hypothetical protein
VCVCVCVWPSTPSPLLLCLLPMRQAATLGNWFSGLLQRHDQLSKWLTMGRPRAYWMTGFFNPQVTQPTISHCGGRASLNWLIGFPIRQALQGKHTSSGVLWLTVNICCLSVCLLPLLHRLVGPPPGLPNRHEAGGQPQACCRQVGPG